jgi:hypothetical protein
MIGSSAGLLLYRWWIFGLCEEQVTINQLSTSQKQRILPLGLRIIRIEIYSAYGHAILARLPCVLSCVGTVLRLADHSSKSRTKYRKTYLEAHEIGELGAHYMHTPLKKKLVY